MVAVVSCDSELLDYEATGYDLYTNSEFISLRYTGLVEDTHEWCASFTDAFCVMLALEIAMSFSKDTNMMKVLEDQFAHIIQTAESTGIIKEETGLRQRRDRDYQPLEYRRYLDYSGIPTMPGRYGYGGLCDEAHAGELCVW